MFGSKVITAVAVALAFCEGSSHAGDDPWFFTADEIARSYKYQQQFGARLRNPLKREQCLYGGNEFTASHQGREFVVPCRFITETLRQLREMLQSGAAKFLFPLDVDQAALGVPVEVWNEKYAKLPREDILPALLHEPTLVAVYHPALHLTPAVMKTNPATEMWGLRRTVIGFYDGRQTEVLSPRSDGVLAYKPEGFHWLGGITVMAHHLGELQLINGETVVTFDMSFDDDRAAESFTNVLASVRE
jgi:hypothetical protein